MAISDFLRRRIKDAILRLRILRRPSISYCVTNELLPEILIRTPSLKVRQMLNLPPLEHRSQLNQDIFALLINRYQPGFFVEIGANDGFTLSNTIYLESCFDWRGVLIEPNPKYKESLARRKGAVVVNKAVGSVSGDLEFIDGGMYGGLSQSIDPIHQDYTNGQLRLFVKCEPITDILKNCNTPDCVDFISVDVEGAEGAVVEQLVKAPYRFKCGCIEHNYRRDDYANICAMLKSANYRVIWEGQTAYDLFFIDGAL